MFPSRLSPHLLGLNISLCYPHVYNLGPCKTTQTNRAAGFFPPCIEELRVWRLNADYISFSIMSVALRGIECLKTLDADSHTHTHDIQTLIQIYLAVESNEKWKLLKSASPFRFIIPLKPCSNVIKIPPTAEKAGIINREVVRMYHNASFRH